MMQALGYLILLAAFGAVTIIGVKLVRAIARISRALVQIGRSLDEIAVAMRTETRVASSAGRRF